MAERGINEGLTQETSAFQTFHGGNATFINLFDKAKFSCLPFLLMQHHSLQGN